MIVFYCWLIYFTFGGNSMSALKYYLYLRYRYIDILHNYKECQFKYSAKRSDTIHKLCRMFEIYNLKDCKVRIVFDEIIFRVNLNNKHDFIKNNLDSAHFLTIIIIRYP